MPAASTISSSPFQTSAVSLGCTLVFEDLGVEPGPVRVRVGEDTLLRVVAGLVRLTSDGGERLLDANEEAIVPAGTLHRLASAHGVARIVTGHRPATA